MAYSFATQALGLTLFEGASLSSRAPLLFNSPGRVAITSPSQFMSRKLLEAIVNEHFTVAAAVEDDTEAFFWVLLYAVTRRLADLDAGHTQAEKTAIYGVHCTTFGGISASEILRVRSPELFEEVLKYDCVQELIPWPLSEVLMDFEDCMRNQKNARSRYLKEPVASEIQHPTRRAHKLAAARRARQQAAFDALQRHKREWLETSAAFFTHDAIRKRLERALLLLEPGSDEEDLEAESGSDDEGSIAAAMVADAD